MTSSQLLPSLEAVARDVDAHLEDCLASNNRRPPRLVAAMRHALFAGGKRMRPFLVVESARLFGIDGAAPLRIAAALEMVHCYSLVHDDLPAMDDDDTRRGKPTVHRAYDEATAILAGDALLTQAFALLTAPLSGTKPWPGTSAARRLRLVRDLAHAAGMDGMVGGQMLDLAAEGRFAPMRRLSASAIGRLQALKTGALISFAAESGATLAPKASRAQRKALQVYGEALGRAFQIKDDLLDVEGDADVVGKALAKDAQAGKATFVELLGIEGARAELERVSAAGAGALSDQFGTKAAMLNALMTFNFQRDH